MSLRIVAPRVLIATALACATVFTATGPARAVAATHYVAASGSVGAGTSCSSPGFVGSTEVSIQAAFNAAASGDTVYICAGTYDISPRLTVTKSLTIRGATAQTSILDGGGNSQIMYIEDQVSDITVNVSNLTFQNGGANTRNGGECNLGSNCGGAIYVDNGSVLNVNNTHFESNRAMFGGAIAVVSASRASSITNSSFESNSTLIDAGAIVSLGGGGLVMDRITVANSYIADGPESRGGTAIVVNFSSATMTNSTLVNNTGVPARLLGSAQQIYVNGSFSIKNSILASTGAGNIPLCSGTTPSNISSGNLLTAASCGVSATYPPGSAGTSTVVPFADLKLGTLGWNGYGSKTVPLLSGSAALNYWSGASCTGSDQRGVSVPQGSSCDTGAYERHASQTLNTPTSWSYGSTPLQRSGVTTFPVVSGSTDPAGQGVTYSSSTTSVCTVNSTTGALTAVSTGTCSLTAYGKTHLLRDEDSTSLSLSIVDAPATTTTTAPPTTVASSTTVAAPSQTTVSPSPTTSVAGSSGTLPVTASTTAVRSSTGSTASTALPSVQVSTTVPVTTTSTTIPAPDVPAAAPGEASATVNGEEIDANLTRSDNALVVKAADVTATIYGTTQAGERIALNADGALVLETGDLVVLSADGYTPGAEVEVWLHSTPVKLATVSADGAGRVSGTFAVPTAIGKGDHRVIVSGTTRTGAESVIGIGLRIGAYGKESNVSKWIISLAITFAVLLGLAIPTTTRRRRRTQMGAK